MMKGIIVDTIQGLEDSGGGMAFAVVWMNPPRIAIDAELSKFPKLRKYILWHEWNHHRITRRYGMTGRARRLHNALNVLPFSYCYFALKRRIPDILRIIISKWLDRMVEYLE